MKTGRDMDSTVYLKPGTVL